MNGVAMVALVGPTVWASTHKADPATEAAKTESNAKHPIWDHPWRKLTSHFLAKLIKLDPFQKRLNSFDRNGYILWV